MSITNCNCMKINTAQIVSDCSFVQYFSMYCPFSAITNRTRIDGVIIVELGISKLLSFEKRFVSIQALFRHKEYRKANYEKKRYLQKNL